LKKKTIQTLSSLISQTLNLPDKHPALAKSWSFGEKSSDALTKKMGSWTFIIIFLFFLSLWITINVLAWTKNWDPYPFILLNLLLSCLAAIQAPIILMSQNRQSQKDRIRSEYDYAVNRKAEREIEQIKSQLDRIEKSLNTKK
jgi:uncharacterized membrane protein